MVSERLGFVFWEGVVSERWALCSERVWSLKGGLCVLRGCGLKGWGLCSEKVWSLKGGFVFLRGCGL